jgi:NAD(P)-dependent dehydrogenase (short-subunit alcohol dehydrogenase family)
VQLAEAGAKVLIVGRDPVKLASVHKEIETRGGRVASYSCDLGDPPACDRFIAQLLQEHGRVDILINNAGRSIRRAVENTYDRFHDYERLMRINYFAAVRVTLGLLPAMVQHGAGHVINISSIGVLTNAPRFAGYNASKAALEAFSRCAAAEYNERGIRFSVLNMPLVRTPMTAPTRIYDKFPLLKPEQAAAIVCDAVVHKPERVASPLCVAAQLLELMAPRISRAIMSESFAMFPESEAAGSTPASAQASTKAVAFASLMRDLHW